MSFFKSHKVFKLNKNISDLENEEFLKQMAEEIKILVENNQKVEINFSEIDSIPKIFALEVIAKVMYNVDSQQFANLVELKNIENKDIITTIDETTQKYFEKYIKK